MRGRRDRSFVVSPGAIGVLYGRCRQTDGGGDPGDGVGELVSLGGGQCAGDVGHAIGDVGVERADDLLSECGGAEGDRPSIALECLSLHEPAAFALYWVTQISAVAYPSARAVDPPGTAIFPQAVIALPSLALVGWGYALERRRLRRQRSREIVGAVSTRTV